MRESLDLKSAPEDLVRHCIGDFVRDSPANRLQDIDGSPIFDPPLVAFASGDDPLFQEYKTIIGPFHLTPREALQLAVEGAPVETVSVICWALPIAETTRASNRAQMRAPSERWAHTRTYGEEFNDALRRHVVATLQAAGYLAIAPVLSSAFKIRDEKMEPPLVSTWSERHILYVAGLGTFGLSDGFITPRGIAMRCGSVVTNLALSPSPRPYPNHTANCLHLTQGTCGVCIERCPAGAISQQGHDKLRCREYVYGKTEPLRSIYGVSTPGCGLCQTGVPCEERIPQGQETYARCSSSSSTLASRRSGVSKPSVNQP